MTSSDARFAELYQLYYRKVLLYCRRRTAPDLVDDAVADTFLAAWRKIKDVPGGSEALPWLYTVAYRAIGHQYRTTGRHRKLRKKLSAIGVPDAADSGELVVTDHESHQVLEALSKLRRSDQELLRLSVWEELSTSEMATVLDISVAAAKKRVTRAKTALARSYQRLERSSPNLAVQRGGEW